MLSLAGTIQEAMRSLAARRPVFHSEADFQLELACELRLLLPSARVRMEVPPTALGLERISRGAVDIAVHSEGVLYLLELKLGKAVADVVVDGERFVYPSPAPDVARYGFLQDVVRLERWSGNAQGAAVILANDRRLWADRRGSWSDSAFDLHDGRAVEGRLDWSDGTSPTTRRQKPGLELQGTYPLHWQEYVRGPMESKFLVVAVG